MKFLNTFLTLFLRNYKKIVNFCSNFGFFAKYQLCMRAWIISSLFGQFLLKNIQKNWMRFTKIIFFNCIIHYFCVFKKWQFFSEFFNIWIVYNTWKDEFNFEPGKKKSSTFSFFNKHSKVHLNISQFFVIYIENN